MLNKFIGIGNLTADPEVRTTTGGKSITTFTLAVNLDKDDKNPLFVDVQTWEKTADACAKYLEKGRKVLVEGRLQLNRWEDEEGNKRQKHYINAQGVKFFPGKNDDASQSSGSASQSSAPASSNYDHDDEDDEEPPF
jgi:single-strand DNA-binding protein